MTHEAHAQVSSSMRQLAQVRIRLQLATSIHAPKESQNS